MSGDGKDRSSSSYLVIPIILRFLEICFCIASFVVMTFMKLNYKGFNSTAYLFSMAITGLILSVIGAAVTFVGRKPAMAVNAIRIQMYISFVSQQESCQVKGRAL
ncbi:unnamed protein product [Closterium sp. NIES-53]